MEYFVIEVRFQAIYGFGGLTQTGSLLNNGQWDCLKTSNRPPMVPLIDG